MVSAREEKALMLLNEFIDEYDITCAEDVSQRDFVNEACVDLVAELVDTLLNGQEGISMEENRQCCGTCVFYNGEIGDGTQFCDEKEVYVSECNWCVRFRERNNEVD